MFLNVIPAPLLSFQRGLESSINSLLSLDGRGKGEGDIILNWRNR
jgi:hypothetical protein